jgi:predicted nucleic acid-binding protein
MLLDSNIIIYAYAAQPEHTALRQFIADHAPAVSAISSIEVLGYHHLSAEEHQLLERFFQAAEVLPLSDAVVQWAIRLRQRRRMTLGDAIVAGTAVAHGHILVTHNTDDFRWISEIKLLDPLAERA